MSTFSPNVISWTEIDRGVSTPPATNPDDALYDWRILAEGDSWFSLGALPSSNLLFELRLNKQAIVVNCATPGDTIRNMAQIGSNLGLAKMLGQRFGYAWDALLLSGGGNDLIDALPEILVYPPDAAAAEDFIDPAQLAGTLDDIAAGFARIVALRDRADSPAQGRPIVIHTYDYPTPRNSPARFVTLGLTGPWLYAALRQENRLAAPNPAATGIPEVYWDGIARLLLDALGDRLLELGNKFYNFHVVDTRGTLQPAAPGSQFASGDWLNEIHPDAAGYRKLAGRLDARLNALLA